MRAHQNLWKPSASHLWKRQGEVGGVGHRHLAVVMMRLLYPPSLIGRLPAAELTTIGARWAPPSRPGLIQRSSQMILPSGVRLTNNHPKPKEAATASVPTNTALTSGGTSNDRPAISRLRRTGTCSMKAA